LRIVKHFGKKKMVEQREEGGFKLLLSTPSSYLKSATLMNVAVEGGPPSCCAQKGEGLTQFVKL
jgi:hypothetical protein